MTDRPKIAFCWLASCGGCEETVIDVAEKILEIVSGVDIVFWPCALDFKYKDVEALSANELAVAFINGAVRTDEQLHIAELLRKKARIVISFGSCSTHGGVVALANLTSKKNIIDYAYHNSPSVVNPEGAEPKTSSKVNGYDLTLPGLHETVRRLSDIVDVDYYMTGCPPTSDNFFEAVGAILSGDLPPKGSTLTPNKSLCGDCARNETKPESMAIPEIRRVIDVELNPDKCFLNQGLVCMGPATRTGCGALCIGGNMPCTGCYGPPDGIGDQGAKMIATLGGVLDGEQGKDIESKIGRLNDPAGTFYRYTLSASMLGSARKEHRA